MPEAPLPGRFYRPESAAFAKALGPYLRALDELAREIALRDAYQALGRGTEQAPRVGSVGQAVERLARIVQEAEVKANLAAREATLKVADRLVRANGDRGVPPAVLERAAAPAPAIAPAPLPDVPYHEAVADVLAREPRLAPGYRAVQTLYNEEHAFAVARSAEEALTKRIQAALTRALAKGTPVSGAVRSLRGVAAAMGADMGDWTRAYAETVFRTNMATAYSAGRFSQMAEPAVRRAIAALRFDGPNDSDARPNHVAALGLIAAPEDPVWNACAPPLGYNCRHGLSFVSWPEARAARLVLPDGTIRRAVVPRGAGPDLGFKHVHRPDIAVYAGG
ncbi:MAG: phage head morphogenesis protein [Planctomycetes bacterium]|jgi:SPP1 gp7 family putative phage head morphogenesis protein|nr:phage head morphogenesis protein [Planctomycetota bacterium]